jgi:TrmH family RNA methyltransferase
MRIHVVLERFAVVLVRPNLPSNLGAVARVTKNLGVSDLRLVEPAAPADEEAHRLASGADDVLSGLRRYEDLPAAIADLPVVVATTSLRGRGRPRDLDLSELPGFLQEIGPTSRVAFLFGPEKSGLKLEDLTLASATVTIPTQMDFPTMNLSHAVAVLLVVAKLATRDPGPQPERTWAAARDVQAMIDHWDRALDAIGFYDTGHHERTRRDWRRLIAGRPLTERDVAILRGVANRVLVALKRSSQLSAFSSQPEEPDSDS